MANVRLSDRQVAAICHEATRQLQRAYDQLVSFPWESTSRSEQDGVTMGVSLAREHPSTTAATSHQRWIDSKIGQGWVYGPVKDFAKKTHPDLVPFDELPTAEKVKDRLFLAIVRALSAD